MKKAILIIAAMMLVASPAYAASEYVLGTAGPDTLYGEDGHQKIRGYGGGDQLYGGAGHDDIRAAKGDDYVAGGLGLDGLFGGRGNDIIEAADGRPDVIDCGPGIDRVSVDANENHLVNCERVQ